MTRKHPSALPQSITELQRTLVMGVVNVTPDSFSDGGLWFTAREAVNHGLELIAQGADIVDVGGESTRPGAARVPEDEEIARVIPVVSELVAAGAVVSVDTTRARVAYQAVEAGAQIINDVSGGLADDDMSRVAAETGVVFIAMHWRGHADVMDSLEVYNDIVGDVSMELLARTEHLMDCGVRRENIVLDPGLGFSKSGENNWPLLRHVDQLTELGYPLLIGASRKRFLGRLLSPGPEITVPPEGRDDATAAVTALVAAHGAWCVRVHDVPRSVAAARVGDAWASC
ncbi:dihydropteroate synthase [Jonesia quinghaiensis]|uniref:dihydropteroate synthase n=1 Tax=Jonesia quinghaiensis TaxID=262806 RepID=UPI0004161B43|nr:dihydropteroate synthase [Jonesia quinghaiensis]